MLSLHEVKAYLRVDFDDDDPLIQSLIDTAREYLHGAVGADCDEENERARLVQKIVIQDLYDNHGLTEKTDSRTRQIVQDFAQQLRLEARGRENG